MDEKTPSQRILELLEASNGACEELAFELSKSPDELESDLRSGLRLTFSEIALASDILKVSASYLAGLPDSEPSLSVSLRIGELCESSIPADVISTVDLTLETSALLDSWLGTPDNRFKNVIVDYHGNAREAGKRTAERVRAVLNISDDPIYDLVEFVESSGIPTVHRSLPQEVAGLNFRRLIDDCYRRAIVVNSQENWSRQRYTLAHELCHALYDDTGQMLVESSETLEAPDALPEVRANSFARHLLLPKRALKNRLDESRTAGTRGGELVAGLMIEFGVSRSVVLNALVDDELVPAERVHSLREANVGELMANAGLKESWKALSTQANIPSASPQLVERAVHAFGMGLVHARVVAQLLERDVESVEAELDQSGWTPAPN